MAREVLTNTIIEKTRAATENEFFFRVHDNIGLSDEFHRLIEFINKKYNIKIIPLHKRSLEQISDSKSHFGGECNFKVIDD